MLNEEFCMLDCFILGADIGLIPLKFLALPYYFYSKCYF